MGDVVMNGLSFQAAGSIAELSNPVVLQQQVLLSLARVPLWGSHRHCLLLSNLHLSQFLQAAELAVVPCNKKRISMGWTGICGLWGSFSTPFLGAAWEQ